jgi:hypothetical protein
MMTLALVLGVTSLAEAQATRTWVSGVGDDANPCSRTAPCKTFAGAISKTAAHGEINVLDPGGFGAVTITKSISIVNEGSLGGIVAAGTNGVIVNAGANDVVVLRGLDINGVGSGLNGIRFLAGGSLTVENCTIYGFTAKGIEVVNSAASKLQVTDTFIRDNPSVSGGGVFLAPGAGGSLLATLDRVRLQNNRYGVRVHDRARAVIRDSVASANGTNGYVAVSSIEGAVLALENSLAGDNGTNGVNAQGSFTTVILSNSVVTGNATGLLATGGASIFSYGNNRIGGNVIDGAPTTLLGQQ